VYEPAIFLEELKYFELGDEVIQKFYETQVGDGVIEDIRY
ncbi:unnamed protein product, partial [Didymodactylos carnosus]